MWDTGRMRVYIPAISSDLVDDRPPITSAFTAVVPPEATGEDADVLEDAAQTEAALVSLMRLREAEGVEARRRIVLAADADAATVAVMDPADATSRIAEVAPGQLFWRDVTAILVDGPDAEEAVEAVLAAGDQEEADRAVAALWEHALEWFDISEREVLLAGPQASGGAPSSTVAGGAEES